jgi:hypothetical protein
MAHPAKFRGMKNATPQVDAYIARAAEFARPILKRVRAAFHKGCPQLEERLKWGVPSFEYKGMMGMMAAFKGHAVWGFWRRKEMEDPHRIFKTGGMGGGGKIHDIAEMPGEKVLVEYVKAAARLNDASPRKKAPSKPKPPAKVPPYFLKALKAAPKALATFQGFTPSQRRDYVEWITGAKQEETRRRRLATAIEWLEEGKRHNWKYEKC